MTDAGGNPDGGGRALSGEARALLRSWASAQSRVLMYPAGHPALEPAVTGFHERLAAFLAERERLAVRVERRWLEVERSASDPEDDLLRGLAERLFGHRVERVAFHDGVTRAELAELLESVASEPGAEPEPSSTDEWRSGDGHVRLRRLRYEPLEVATEPEAGAGRPEPRAPLGPHRIAGSDLRREEPVRAAQRLGERLEDPEAGRVAALQLLRLTEALARDGGEREAELRDRASRLILALSPEALERVLTLAGEGGHEHELPVAAAAGLELDAALRLLEAAARRGEESPESRLLDLVVRLTLHAPGGDAAERNIQRVVDRVLERWQLEDPRPEDYEGTLHRMAVSPAEEAGMTERRARAIFLSPERVLKMGLELDERVGPIREAAEQLMREGRFGTLAMLLEQAPETNALAGELWDRLSRPDVVARLLATEPPGFALLGRLVGPDDVELVPPLLDALASERAESRTYWRRVFNLLVTIGPGVLPHVPERLEDGRWFVRRNLLSLLRELPGRPEGFSPLAHLSDPDPRVRVEALHLALEHPEERVAALERALADENTRMVGVALTAAETSFPPSLEPRLAELLEDRDRPVSFRARAARLLTDGSSPRALEALVGTVRVRRWLFWRRLAPAGPVTEAALEALARGWADDPAARRILEEARTAEDGRLREAATPGGGTGAGGAAGGSPGEGSRNGIPANGPEGAKGHRPADERDGAEGRER